MEIEYVMIIMIKMEYYNNKNIMDWVNMYILRYVIINNIKIRNIIK
jgi:hypothetical protein